VKAWVVGALTVVVFAAVAALGWHDMHTHVHDTHAVARRGEWTVGDAVSRAGPGPLAVRGWVFNDVATNGLRLCDGIRSGSPPSCLGPFVDLYNVDAGTFSLKKGHDAKAGPVQWLPDPVAVYGTLKGTAFTVQSVLR
jgi:hypothetical protein